MSLFNPNRAALYLKLMRFHQPTGIWLLLWPCWWSITLASQKPWPEVYLLALFALGAITMRSAGCVINDIIDREIDAKVARTKDRPLASGKLSLLNAIWLVIVLLAFGLIVLLQLNFTAIFLGLLSFLPVLIYPYMKRVMSWPQMVLAFTFNAGALVGWAAVTGELQLPAITTYIACIFWTLGYDTIYAHQDKLYDEKIGVKSSALALKEKSKIYLSIFYLMVVLMLMVSGSLVFKYHNLIYYSSLIVALGQLLWQIKKVDLDNPADCMQKFKSNAWFGWIVFIGIILEKSLSY